MMQTSMELVPSAFVPFIPCKICGVQAHGRHFGVISCRACAAFFRRASVGAKTIYKCAKNDDCKVWNNGRFNCKKCRLARCQKAGMDPGKFQFDRDAISTAVRPNFHEKLPETIEHLIGRSHLLLFLEPTSSTTTTKSFIDCQFLIDKATKVLTLGSEKPILARNSLEKLAIGLQMVRDRGDRDPEPQMIQKIGKEETLLFWEKDFLTVAKFLTYFDEFQLLPRAQQMLLLKAVWHVWSRLDKLALTASGRSRNLVKDKVMMVGCNKFMDVRTVELDISWFTKCTKQQLSFFFDEVEDLMMIPILDPLVELQPTDTEISYMMCQLCFHYAGKRFQGEILKVTEKLQESLANDLHDYYINEMKMPRYCARLSQMMKINNRIQQDIWEKRSKYEIARVFDIYRVEFSHPEMFQDTAC